MPMMSFDPTLSKRIANKKIQLRKADVEYRKCPKCVSKEGKHDVTLHKRGKMFYCKICGYKIKRGEALAAK